MNFQNCSTINKLLRHSISNTISKILSVISGMFMNFQVILPCTHFGDIQFPTVIVKSHVLHLNVYEFPGLYHDTHIAETFNSL